MPSRAAEGPVMGLVEARTNIAGPSISFTEAPMSRNDRCRPARALGQGSARQK
jgi:hypothetical protein